MDEQFRLTKWEEWVVGESYLWKKGRVCGPAPLKCVEVNRAEGCVVFESGTKNIISSYNWTRRFVHVPGNNGLTGPKGP